MARRLEFRNELAQVMGDKKLYFQPPDGSKITYPCCIYKLQTIDARHADDLVYKDRTCYQVTIIDPDPDTEYPDKMLHAFRYVRFDRFFISDNLNHFVFSIYY